MKIFSTAIHSILLITTPALMASSPGLPNLIQQHQPIHIPDLRTLAYDEVMDLIALVESDSFDERYSFEEVEQINQFFAALALEGATTAEKPEMECAVASLLQQNDIQYAIYSGSSEDLILCSNIFVKKYKKTVSFIKKHKKAIIIGTIAVVTTGAVIVTAGALSGCAIAAATAATGALTSNATSKDPISSLQDQLTTFKETIAQEQFAAITESNEISLEENGRIIGSLFAHQTIDTMAFKFAQNPSFANELKDFNYLPPKWLQTYPDSSCVMPHPSADLAFSTNYAENYPLKAYDLNLASYQTRADFALSSGYLNQAVHDFGQAIMLDPTNPFLHLERGIANFELGNYEKSFLDYTQFVEKKKSWIDSSLDVALFGVGFAKGVPKGAYESGKETLLFLSDFVTHPIQTSRQIIDSISQLATLLKNDEFGVVAEAISPELYQLATQWNTLSSETRGELAGYVVGKLGTDLLAPGVMAKVASKSVKSAKELVTVCKNLQIAQEILVLETATGIGTPLKVAEIVGMGKKKLTLGEGLALIDKEIKFSVPGLTAIQEKIFLSSASEKYNEHLTQLAHALSKHSGRKNTFWNQPTGPMNTWHAQALEQLELICNAPGEFKEVFDTATGLTWIEKRLPNGKGIRLNQDYTFKGFLD